MSNAVEFVAFNLKEGISVSDFLLVSDKFNAEFLSKQKGYISRKLLLEGEKWADFVLWETVEDIQNAYKAAEKDRVACEYVSCLDPNNCKGNFFTIEKDYSHQLRGHQ